MSVTVVLADDHRVFSEGLRALLQLEDGIDVVAICIDGAEALEAVEQYAPDVLVIDEAMPGLTGLSVLQALRDRGAETRGVLLTATLSDESLLAALQQEVPGIMLKETAATDLVECVRAVARGEKNRHPGMADRGLELALHLEQRHAEGAAHLTPRQEEVLGLVAEGLPNKRIANRLDVSEGTVKAHVHQLFKKLNVSNRVQLVLSARASQLASKAEPE